MTISWVNPTVDIQGNALTDFSGVKIYRDGALVATVNCTIADAGKSGSYEDKGLTAGNHTYKIVPFNSKGDGGADTDPVGAYVGANAPGAVVNFKVVQGDSKALLSWEAPTEGKFGGEFDPASITKYVVNRISGTQKTKFEITEGTSFADAPSFGTYTYSIYAVNEVGDGVETTSAPIMVKPADWIVMKTGEEVADGENLVLTFVNEVPVEIQVIGSDNYTYTRPTLTINNIKSDLEIVNATGELILFEQLESTVFTGSNYINTGVVLFNQANMNRNFVISFEIEDDNQNQATYGTLFSLMDESGSPYPGFLFRIGSSSHSSEYELTANSVAGSGKAYYNPRNTTKKVELARIDGILYARINEGYYEKMHDYT